MSEFDWIARYFAPLATRAGAAGLRDDAAELSGAASIMTVDAMVEGVHFLSTDPIDTVARKLVRVNVSDLIAKGALPDEAVLTLGWPAARDEAELAAFADALGEELSLWGASLIGGDTVLSPAGLFLSLTVTGRAAGARAPIRRSGAKPGDKICVTGQIGAGFVGLAAAKALKSAEETLKTAEAVHRYRVPQIPGLDIASLIASYANASMDVSDGLLADLTKLLAASECGGRLDLDRVPLFHPCDILDDVLAQVTGGDDYQCLFTVPEAALNELAGAPMTIIGEITSATGLQLVWQGGRVEMPERAGFQHG